MIPPFPILCVALLVGAFACPCAWAQDPISKSEITELREALVEGDNASSSIRVRRAYKGVARDATRLIEDAPSAPNRWTVLGIVFQAQKRLLSVDNTDDHRKELLTTSGLLAQAPDEFADLRVEAELLISEAELSTRNADVTERTTALSEFLIRNRGTSGEVKSLKMASLMAPKLEAFELEKQIFRTMNERFAGDYDLLEWRRQQGGAAHERILFSGSYERSDGTTLRFPSDGIGHTYALVFWSQDSPDLEPFIAEIVARQEHFPGWLEVFSFNLDELPDAGETKLREMGLDWQVMHLPGGRKSQVYRVVARQDPVAVRVNPHGHAFRPAPFVEEVLDFSYMEQNMDEPRYHAQLQSLLAGDFFIAERAAVTGGVPKEILNAIRSCFLSGPLRYRQTSAETIANYTKARELCENALASHPNATDLGWVRSARIVALMGVAKAGFKPLYLDEAATHSEAALQRTETQPLLTLVARFCLARLALREGKPAPTVLGDLIEKSGGNEATPLAHAAAAILAMDVSAIEEFPTHREQVLTADENDPMFWPIRSFLLDQNHRFRLFRPNFYLPPSLARRQVRSQLRGNAAAIGVDPGYRDPMKVELRTLDGGTLNFPKAAAEKLTLLLFIEPLLDPEADWPTLINGSVSEDTRGKIIETKGVMARAFDLAAAHVNGELAVIPVFLSDDEARVKDLMEKHQWPGTAAMLPGGLSHPLVRKLGILSPDQVPNIVMLRPDGTILWRLSGLIHPQVRSEGLGESLTVTTRGMPNHLLLEEVTRSVETLEKGEFTTAVKRFSGPFEEPEKFRADEWTAPRYHGRALARMALKDWEPALADLDIAIQAHEWTFNNRKTCVCQQVAKLRLLKSDILRQLGRNKEADTMRELASDPKAVHGDSRARRLHQRLEKWSAETKP